jgi:hypothetical protein
VTTSSQRVVSPRRSYALEILLVSFAALLLEISYTRVISFKLFYYYTVKRDPITIAEVDRFLTALSTMPGSTLRYAPGHRVTGESVSDIATLPGSRLDRWYDSYPYDVRPITDDSPFFWHFTPFRDVLTDFGEPIDRGDFEVDVGERVLVLLLGIATLFAAVFLLLLFVRIRNI